MSKYTVTLSERDHPARRYVLKVEAENVMDAVERAKLKVAQRGFLFINQTLEQKLDTLYAISVMIVDEGDKVEEYEEPVNKIDKTKHYFALMRPLEFLPLIGWAVQSSDAPERWVECKIVEDHYKVVDGYKVTLKAIEPGFGREDYYQNDFKSLMDKGYIIMKTRERQHIEDVTWIEPLTGCVYLVHTASVVIDD